MFKHVALAGSVVVALAAAAPSSAWSEGQLYAQFEDRVGAGTYGRNRVGFSVSDRKCDSQAARGDYIVAGQVDWVSVHNSAGCGSTVNKYAGTKIVQVRACAALSHQPDRCSAWKG